MAPQVKLERTDVPDQQDSDLPVARTGAADGPEALGNARELFEDALLPDADAVVRVAIATRELLVAERQTAEQAAALIAAWNGELAEPLPARVIELGLRAGAHVAEADPEGRQELVSVGAATGIPTLRPYRPAEQSPHVRSPHVPRVPDFFPEEIRSKRDALAARAPEVVAMGQAALDARAGTLELALALESEASGADIWTAAVSAFGAAVTAVRARVHYTEAAIAFCQERRQAAHQVSNVEHQKHQAIWRQKTAEILAAGLDSRIEAAKRAGLMQVAEQIARANAHGLPEVRAAKALADAAHRLAQPVTDADRALAEERADARRQLEGLVLAFLPPLVT